MAPNKAGPPSHKRQNNCTAASPANVLLRARSYLIYTTLGLGCSRSRSRRRRQAGQVKRDLWSIPRWLNRIVKKNARCFCPVVTKVASGTPFAASK